MHEKRLIEALRNLANEASGFLALSDIQRHGHTNSRVLRLRIEEARDAIVAANQGSNSGSNNDGELRILATNEERRMESAIRQEFNKYMEE